MRSVAELLPLFQEAIAKHSPTRGTYFRNRRFTSVISHNETSCSPQPISVSGLRVIQDLRMLAG